MTTTTKEPGTALARSNGSGITGLIQSRAQRLQPLLPHGMTLEQLQQIVYFETKRNPDLLRCTPDSIVSAVSRVLRSGLELGETCHLVPFGKHCTFIADYKGLAQLMIAAGAVRAIEMEVVREGDEFEFRLGLNADLVHRPTREKDRHLRPITHAYAVFRLPFGQSTFKVMPVEEIEHIRRTYSKQWKQGALPAWYACKTVIRQAAKTWPKDRRLASFRVAIEADEREEFGRVIDDAEPGQLVSGPDEEMPEVIDDADETDAERAARLREDQELAAQEDGELPLADTRKPRQQKNAIAEGR